MVRALSKGKITVKMSGVLQNVLPNSGGTVEVKHPSLSYNVDFTDGLGDNQANRAWQKLSGVLVSGASQTFDLYDMSNIDIGTGAGKDGVGMNVSPFEEIVAIAIVNDNAITAAGQLEIQPSSEDGWQGIGTHTVANGGALRGQGLFLMTQPCKDGFDITDGSANRIKLSVLGGSVTYSMYLIARHDDEESSSSSISSQSSKSSSSVSSASSESSSWSSYSSSSESSKSSSSPSSSGKSSSSQSMSTSSSSQSSESSSSPSSKSSSSASSVSSISSSGKSSSSASSVSSASTSSFSSSSQSESSQSSKSSSSESSTSESSSFSISSSSGT